MAGSASTMEREDGFAEELKAKFPNIVLAGMQFGMADRARSMSITENFLTAHPDLGGIFADNESSSSGAVQALKSRQNKTVKLVAFDASDQLVADLKEGWIDSLILQDPFRMGYDSVKAITEKRAGKTPQARVDLPATLATRDDLAAGRVASALRARRLVYMSDVPGVLSAPPDPASLISTLRTGQVDELKKRGVIDKGMRPKVQSAVRALQEGVQRVHFIDGRLPHSLLLEMFTDRGIGTEIVQG